MNAVELSLSCERFCSNVQPDLNINTIVIDIYLLDYNLYLTGVVIGFEQLGGVRKVLSIDINI